MVRKGLFDWLTTVKLDDFHFLSATSKDLSCMLDEIDGVAMGSPLDPTLADIFMCALEQNFLANCPSEFQQFQQTFNQ